MTEDEAKTKRCCGPSGCGRLIPVERDEAVVPLHAPVQQFISVCIGSECMAFRWDQNYTDGLAGVRHGHCGLAGKP
jgi:hypothetical protein